MERRHICPILNCGRTFTRLGSLNRHRERFHNANNDRVEACLLCGDMFNSGDALQRHILRRHRPSDDFYERQSAFQRTLVVYRYNFSPVDTNFNNAQYRIFDKISDVILYEAARKVVIKASLVFICQMSMHNTLNDEIHTILTPFRSSGFVTNAGEVRRIRQKIRESFQAQENLMEEFCNSGNKFYKEKIDVLSQTFNSLGSNWVFDRAIAYDVEIAGLKPMVVGAGGKREFEADDDDEIPNFKKNRFANFKSEQDFFDNDRDEDGEVEESTSTSAPKSRRVSIADFKNKKFLFNPEYDDDFCFLRCVHNFLDGPLGFDNWKNSLNLQGVSFPITISNIAKFLRLNKNLNLKINILFRNTSKEIYPYQFGIGEGTEIINLLMFYVEVEDAMIVSHFVRIKDADKFLRAVYHEGKKIEYQKVFFCLNCLSKFSSSSKRDTHEERCCINKPRLEVLPENSTIKFSNHIKQHEADYVGFLDFESALLPNTEVCNECRTLRCKCDKSFTENVSAQTPIAFSFVVVNSKNEIVHEYTYSGEDAGHVLISHLLEQEENWIKDLLSTIKSMNYTDEAQEDFENSTACYLCNMFFEKSSDKNRDHNHFTGEYLGAACTRCNLQRRRPKFLNIYLHNGSRYDFHFIIEALKNFTSSQVRRLDVLPYNTEHFRVIKFNSFAFNDTLAFLQSSLSQLSEDLSKTDHDYPILKQTYLVKKNGKFDKVRFQAVLGKSFFPYEYCTSLELMKATTSLPPREAFYSSLSEETITEEDYTFAKKVWSMYGCQNLVDYTEVYCKIDTILLAEIFQKFRKDMLQFSGLDPANYISLPGFSFDAMLKQTKCKIQLPDDIEIVHFIESSIRGGVSYINTRYLDVQDEDGEIIYIDANVRYTHIFI